MKFNKEMLRVYAVTDRRWLRGKTLPEAVEEALKGGATLVQLREKEMDSESLAEEAVQVLAVCRRYKPCGRGGAGAGRMQKIRRASDYR